MADISVPYWNIVDVNMLCEGARLIGFDLDNTLARSKKPMKADMAECFSALTSLIDVAVITGGKYSLLQSQVVDRLSDHADKSKLQYFSQKQNENQHLSVLFLYQIQMALYLPLFSLL